MDFHASAGRHGIPKDDVRHAVAHFFFAAEIDPDEPPARVLYLGPEAAGNLLEVVVIERDDGSELVIHAMKMRRAYESLLPGLEDRR